MVVHETPEIFVHNLDLDMPVMNGKQSPRIFDNLKDGKE